MLVKGGTGHTPYATRNRYWFKFMHVTHTTSPSINHLFYVFQSYASWKHTSVQLQHCFPVHNVDIKRLNVDYEKRIGTVLLYVNNQHSDIFLLLNPDKWYHYDTIWYPINDGTSFNRVATYLTKSQGIIHFISEVMTMRLFCQQRLV